MPLAIFIPSYRPYHGNPKVPLPFRSPKAQFWGPVNRRITEDPDSVPEAVAASSREEIIMCTLCTSTKHVVQPKKKGWPKSYFKTWLRSNGLQLLMANKYIYITYITTTRFAGPVLLRRLPGSPGLGRCFSVFRMIDSKMGLIPRTVVKSGELNWDLLGICWG